MSDSFITYDSRDGVDSPGYLSQLRAQMFRAQAHLEFQTNNVRSAQSIPYKVEMVPQEVHYEANSHESNYSTNPSTKDSPDHNFPDDNSGEDEKNNFSKVPPIIRKGIRKYYEPIIDNNIIYNYEDDPNEYRKARK